MTDNIDPLLWGKSGWIFINSIGLTFKPENKDKYKQFLIQLSYILPCSNCGENLKKNIVDIDSALKSKKDFMYYLLKIRNGINTDNGLPLKTMDDNLNEIYNNNANNNIDSNNYCHIHVMVFIVIILVLLFMLYRNKKTDEQQPN